MAENKGTCTYHLKEKALRDVHVGCQCCLHNGDVDRDDNAHHRSSADGTEQLGREQDEATNRR